MRPDGWQRCEQQHVFIQSPGRRVKLSKIQKLLRRQSADQLRLALSLREAGARLGSSGRHRADRVIPARRCSPAPNGWAGSSLRPSGPRGRGFFTPVRTHHGLGFPLQRKTIANAIEGCEEASAFFGGVFKGEGGQCQGYRLRDKARVERRRCVTTAPTARLCNRAGQSARGPLSPPATSYDVPTWTSWSRSATTAPSRGELASVRFLEAHPHLCSWIGGGEWVRPSSPSALGHIERRRGYSLPTTGADKGRKFPAPGPPHQQLPVRAG